TKEYEEYTERIFTDVEELHFTTLAFNDTKLDWMVGKTIRIKGKVHMGMTQWFRREFAISKEETAKYEVLD
ncbi:MAG: hypothetical protein ACI81T_003144, partial [Bacteroidia bacterium]